MTTQPPIVITQSFDGMVPSTSTAAVEPSTLTAPPKSMMQIGTSALAQATLICVLWAHDSAPFQRNADRPTMQHGAVVQAVAPVPTARSSEMVNAIIKAFGLNRSQAADVMQVRRQSVYNWIGGAEAEGENLGRLLTLYEMANSIAAPVEPHLTVRSTSDGTNCLLRMLSADPLDRTLILSCVADLAQPSEAPWPPSLDDVLRDAGVPRNAERERQRGADGVRYLQG